MILPSLALAVPVCASLIRVAVSYTHLRRHFMKLMAGVGAGIAFSGTLGTFTPKAFAADIKGKTIEAEMCIRDRLSDVPLYFDKAV